MLGNATFPIPETGGQIPEGTSTVWPPPSTQKREKSHRVVGKGLHYSLTAEDIKRKSKLTPVTCPDAHTRQRIRQG